MITVHEYSDCLRPDMIIQECACPYCYRALKWVIPDQNSPLTCSGCCEQLMDFSRVLNNIDWRIRYHFEESP